MGYFFLDILFESLFVVVMDGVAPDPTVDKKQIRIGLNKINLHLYPKFM